MRRWITAFFTFGVCALPTRASAEPKVPASSAKNAKGSASGKKLLSDSQDERYETLVALADTDHDGAVTRTEIEALVQRHVQKQVEARFERLDRNRDGRVTRAEVPTMASARFARFDVNGDGTLTIDELGFVVQREAAEHCRVVFARLDLDGDGALSRSDADSARPTRVTRRELANTAEDREVQR